MALQKSVKKPLLVLTAIVHASIVGRNCFVDFKAVIKKSTIGDNCHIGVGAIIIGVDMLLESMLPIIRLLIVRR